MPLRVNNNIIALNTRRHLLINNRQLATRVERLSSGLRINRAADDAAGLSVSEGMRAEVSGFRQAVRNAEHGTNLIQTAEGALKEVSTNLIRMRELAVQSASSTLNDNNRTASVTLSAKQSLPQRLWPRAQPVSLMFRSQELTQATMSS